uniref:AAA family ATPase n=1 Tax=Thaumasiovibrio occultus TaxID=1891184 RepID=UPI000B34DCA7|nr:AAA family ATPase [Thaumasiovibrio occultus]
MRIGLTLGKYSPFHRGHQSVIDTALAEMDHVIVIIYPSPETTNIAVETRAQWIRDCYPSVEVLIAYDGPREVGYSDELKRKHETYLRQLLAGRAIRAFYCAEPYGEHVSAALNCIDRRVERINPDWAGTVVRSDPYRFRHCVEPLVYRGHIRNIVFLGAPSTGKSTLSEALAKKFNTLWMPEYGREYWEKHQHERRLTPSQLVEIAEGHLIREEALLSECRQFLFTDTNAITTYMFGMDYHNAVEPKLAEYAKQAEQRYDAVFVCGDDIPYDNTWDRSGDQHRKAFQQAIIDDLNYRQVPFTLLTGSLEARIEQVSQQLASLVRY